MFGYGAMVPKGGGRDPRELAKAIATVSEVFYRVPLCVNVPLLRETIHVGSNEVRVLKTIATVSIDIGTIASTCYRCTGGTCT